ncbi:hypothetical protein [Chryseoglobus sp. 28M-23]|uniref:hypothetical protein n=1 Tax=Chryseoglobus sp. 28M-23 TaxID=2772253 RepID=UPI001746473A|nr:hypothetical protein [Chryseoglobus sp. 28M-23]QOD93702.1 hypothetical protein IE160_00135 [Chryseoglobus sp. 28M-23]
MPDNLTELEQRVASMTRALRTGLKVIAALACALSGVVALVSINRAGRDDGAGVGWDSWISAAAFVATLVLGLTGIAITSALAGGTTDLSIRRPREARASSTATSRARRTSREREHL